MKSDWVEGTGDGTTPRSARPEVLVGRAAEQRNVSSEARPSPNFWLLLLTVSLGGVFAPLNSTMLAVALPELRRDFNVGHAEIAWLVSSYLIAMAVAQPLGGRLGDQLGRANVFRNGLLAFLALSLACAAAPTFPLLILLRTGQALVGAAIIPNGMAMLRESVPPDRLGRSGGLTGSAMSIAAAVGPLLGAALLTLGSWRLLFLVNVPLVAAALLAFTILSYPRTRERRAFDLDWMGAASLAALLVAITLLLNSLGGGQSTLVLTLALVALPVFLIIFVRRQFSAANPMAEWRLFRIRSYAGATAYILLSNLVMYTTLLSVPFFVEEVQGKGNLAAGTLLAAISLPMTVLSPVGGRISDSIGRRPLVIAGSVLVTAAVTALAVGIDESSTYVFLVTSLAILGIGLAISFGPASAAAIESSPRDLAGTAAGTNSMMRYLGSIAGAGVLGAVLDTESGVAEISLFRIIFAVLVVMAVLAFASSLLIHRFPPEMHRAPVAPSVPAMAENTAAPQLTVKS
jgi:EmrB/QacA subfamily drug resistance transporter